MNSTALNLREVNFDNLERFFGEVLEVTNDGRYFAVRAWHIAQRKFHFFVCEQFSYTSELTVIYYAADNAADADDVWDLYVDSGAGMDEADVALSLFLDMILSDVVGG